ncbi:MAG: M23 family metallopeptidase [Myxococcales bacterium]|jgi:murein DD-endopeptidase MepM/ murein hydrolase activator NlpD|nr:M23 family metallopeptidase [Myxococcales bacterium]
MRKTQQQQRMWQRLGSMVLVAIAVVGFFPVAGHAADRDTAEAAHRIIELPNGASLRVRPALLTPGGFFEFEVRGAGQEIESLALRLDQGRFEAFQSSPERWRGYGALRASASAGTAELEVEQRDRQGIVHRHQTTFAIASKDFPSTQLKVAPKFTQPSAAQKARNKKDQKAFAAAYAAPFGPPLFETNFANPVAPDARVNSVFGGRRVFNGKTKSRHLGLDLDGVIGTPIYAAADGVVRMRRDCFYAGNAVVLSHGAGIFTAYFHLDEFAVEEGQPVRKGQLLGKMGKTGRVTGPHLHLSAKVGATTFDPAALMAFDFFPEGAQPPVVDVINDGLTP